MSKQQRKHPCVQCSKIFDRAEDVPTDTTLTRGQYINAYGERRLFNGYLCEMHINDMEWVGRPVFVKSGVQA